MAKYAYAPLSVDPARRNTSNNMANPEDNNRGENDFVQERMPLCVGMCVLLAIVFVLSRSAGGETSDIIANIHDNVRTPATAPTSIGALPTMIDSSSSATRGISNYATMDPKMIITEPPNLNYNTNMNNQFSTIPPKSVVNTFTTNEAGIVTNSQRYHRNHHHHHHWEIRLQPQQQQHILRPTAEAKIVIAAVMMMRRLSLDCVRRPSTRLRLTLSNVLLLRQAKANRRVTWRPRIGSRH